jgi:hypothetical protein
LKESFSPPHPLFQRTLKLWDYFLSLLVRSTVERTLKCICYQKNIEYTPIIVFINKYRFIIIGTLMYVKIIKRCFYFLSIKSAR